MPERIVERVAILFELLDIGCEKIDFCAIQHFQIFLEDFARSTVIKWLFQIVMLPELFDDGETCARMCIQR